MPGESKTSVLLLPGMDGTGVLFADLVAELPSNWKVTVAQYPSDKFLNYEQLLTQVQTILPHGHVLLVAESFSTPLAVRLAASLSEHVTGIVLAAGFVANPLGRRASIAKVMARPAAFRATPPLWVLKKFLVGGSASRELVQRVRDAIRRVSPDVLAQRASAVLSCDERTSLEQTRMPLLYLQAKHDRLVGNECFEVIRKGRPDAQLEVIDAPHLVLQCAPRESAEAIVRFANSQRG